MSYLYQNEIKMDHQQPLDCSTSDDDVLDLCVRKRVRCESPEEHNIQQKPYPDPPTSMICFSSPGSHAGSETSETSYPDTLHSYPTLLDEPISKPKVPRPFKAYPRNPLTLTMGVAQTETIIGKDGTDAYVEFRQRMLSQVQHQTATNAKMRRTTISANPNNSDPTYWEKRRKNNEAAKRSRDARRAKEDEIAIRCAFLEQENIKLRYENAALRNENERLRGVMYN